MPLDTQFIGAATTHFSPFRLSSGTELVSPLLYSLARLIRPKSVVEYGSGYSTLFLLRALADNVLDVELERRSLHNKTSSTRLLERLASADSSMSADSKAATLEWIDSGEIASNVDPLFYLELHNPHLFSFECLPADHDYVQRMRSAVSAVGHEALFTHICGESFRREALPSAALPIDLAWNDNDRYTEFFSEFWDLLNPSGGIMIFHNVPGTKQFCDAIQSMVQQRSQEKDLECLVLEERHKLIQNGCAILRRTTNYKPRFSLSVEPPEISFARPDEITQALRVLFP